MNDQSIRESDLIFHLIYLPHTVRYLYPFVATLLRHSDCNFILVSNDCTAEEKRFLKQECANNKRLTFTDLPTTNGCWDHGRSLNYLYQQTLSDYFCFIDSDIFATGRFLPQFLPYITAHDCVSSCSSLWATEADKTTNKFFHRIAGRHNHTSEGQCLGSSYFTIYKRSSLEACNELCDVNFRRLNWAQLPQSMQHVAQNMKLRKKKYDTAKMINLALIAHGFTLFHAEADHLIHLGSVSAVNQKNALVKNSWRASLATYLPGQKLQFQLLRRAVELDRTAVAQQLFTKDAPQQIKDREFDRITRKLLVGQYFMALLVALIDNEPKPHIPFMHDQTIQNQLKFATEQLNNLLSS